MGPSSCIMVWILAITARRASTSKRPSASVSSWSKTGFEYSDSFQGTPVR